MSRKKLSAKRLSKRKFQQQPKTLNKNIQGSKLVGSYGNHLCMSAILTGGAYSISQIQQMETEWLKWLLIATIVGVGIFMFVLICKWIWPRRNIN
jgi:hypothetical protein